MKLSEIKLQSWAIYESNVQNYRSYSATVQSFFLAVGSVLYSNPSSPSYLLGLINLIGVLHVLVIWMPVIFARNYIVDYHKFQSELNDESRVKELAKVCSEHEYVKNKGKREKVNEEFFNGKAKRMLRTTRFKFDVCVPMSFVLIWAALFYWRLYPALIAWFTRM